MPADPEPAGALEEVLVPQVIPQSALQDNLPIVVQPIEPVAVPFVEQANEEPVASFAQQPDEQIEQPLAPLNMPLNIDQPIQPNDQPIDDPGAQPADVPIIDIADIVPRRPRRRRRVNALDADNEPEKDAELETMVVLANPLPNVQSDRRQVSLPTLQIVLVSVGSVCFCQIFFSITFALINSY